MSGIKGFAFAKTYLSLECGLFPPGSLGHDRASCIYKRRNTGIGHTNQFSPGFDGSNRAEVEVVAVARRIFPPSVVCDHADKALFPGQVLGAIETEDGLKTDNRQDADRSVGQLKMGASLAKAVGAAVSAELQGVFPQKAQILHKGHALE